METHVKNRRWVGRISCKASTLRLVCKAVILAHAKPPLLGNVIETGELLPSKVNVGLQENELTVRVFRINR